MLREQRVSTPTLVAAILAEELPVVEEVELEAILVVVLVEVMLVVAVEEGMLAERSRRKAMFMPGVEL